MSNNRYSIITGGASGLGFEVAVKLLENNHSVILAVRNLENGNKALTILKKKFPIQNIKILELDISSKKSIYDFANQIISEKYNIDVLFHNAGIMAVKGSINSDGYDLEMATNYLGPFLLTSLLWETLKISNARIVTVISDEYKKAEINQIELEDLSHPKKDISPMNWYAITKLFLLMFSIELQNKISSNNLKVISTSSHPGLANTGLPNNVGNLFVRPFFKLGMKYFGQSPADGAQSLIYAGISNDVKGGDLFGPGGLMGIRGLPKKEEIKNKAINSIMLQKLWLSTEALLNIKFNVS